MKITQNWLSSIPVALAVALAVAGCSGNTGAAGKDGVDGTNGTNGADGAKGTNGTNGTNGKDGVATNGKDGAKGTNGTDGTDGTNGTNGTNGLDGLNGLDGDAGIDGQDGLMGAMGLPGASGIIDRTKLTGKFVIYPLAALQTSGVTGTVRFAEFVDGTTLGTLITVRVKGVTLAITQDTIRVSHVHYNDVATGGSPAITLNKVDGFTADGTGMSETLVTHVDLAANDTTHPGEVFKAGAAITYGDLVGTGVMGSGTGFNGYVNVHVIATDTVANTASTAAVAAGNIGKNY